MTDHKIGTREKWLAARLELIKAEKALTRRSDELAQWRQKLPWVRIDKEYRFETDEGTASLADLFRGRSQLLVYHFMFGPEYIGGLPGVLGDRGWLQRLRRAPRAPRRRYDRGLARPDCRAAGLQTPVWAGRSRGRRRWTATSTTTSIRRSPRSSSAPAA